MRSRNWSREFVLACATISLLSAQTPPAAAPAIALVDAADAAQWEALAKAAGWRIITAPPADSPDTRAQALQTAVEKAIQSGGVDPARVYLAGRGAATAAVFYTISRVPDLWAAAIGIEGSPQPALESGHLYAANFTGVPLLWIGKAEGDAALAARLKDAGLNLEFRPAAGFSDKAVLEWLAAHKRDAYPAAIDCETDAPVFARCYWIQMTKFDPQERNDMVPSTRLQAGSGAYLNIGGFGYNTGDPGPGIAVTLPPKYSGPLKAGDRIVALEGRPIADGRAYVEMLGKYTEPKSLVATVQRGKERIRIDTWVALPRKDAVVTARVQAKYLPADQQIQISSRTVTEMRLTVPWAGIEVYWNGTPLENIDGAGCYLLTEQNELLHATRCP
jgi:hypothetical protein